jgi:hypothetical protein
MPSSLWNRSPELWNSATGIRRNRHGDESPRSPSATPLTPSPRRTRWHLSSVQTSSRTSSSPITRSTDAFGQLQPPLERVTGGNRRRRSSFRHRRHLPHVVCYFLAVADHRSELAVDPLDALAGIRLAGEPSLLPFFPVPSIQIRRPRIEGLTESVPAYSAAPRRPGWSAPSQTRQNEFNFEIQISDSVLILQNRYKIKYLAKNYKLDIYEILEMCRTHFYRETSLVLWKFWLENKMAKWLSNPN